MEPKSKKPTVVILFNCRGSQHRLTLEPKALTRSVEQRGKAALGEINWCPPMPGLEHHTSSIVARALLQLGAGVYNPLPEGAAVPRGVYPSSPENPAANGESTLTIILDGEVEL